MKIARLLSAPRHLAWLAIVWERLWPRLLPVLCVIALFLTVSWLNIWPQIPDLARLGLLIAFAIATIASLWPLRLVATPTQAEEDARIERMSELAHRPVTAQEDMPAKISGNDDPFARALWQEHKKRMANSLTDLKVGKPDPKIAAKDPYALRAVIGLLLFVGIAAGWGNFTNRIGDAFKSHIATAANVKGRIDAWVKPPAYTNRPPIFLTRNDTDQTPVTVPEGSELVVRVADLEKPKLVVSGSAQENLIEPEKGEGENKESLIFSVKLAETGRVRLLSGIDEIDNWRFNILPDADPTVTFVEDPTGSTRGAFEFAYAVTDDYGVTVARGDIKSTRTDAAGARPLIKAPELNLPLPSRNAKSGTSKTSQDLTAHPWAGVKVTLQLEVEDQAGQIGKSDIKTFVLPERIFTKPLALALIDERRNLALDANNAPQVAEMLNVISDTHPEHFIKNVPVYTAIRVAYRSIARAKSDDELRDALDLLWETALSIEDGGLSRAEKRLRDAQERLSKALENGATDEEIDELMKELRQAMNEFMQELAQQMQRNQQNQQAMPLDENTQVLRQQDLERMMKQIEDLAKSGSKDAARKLLEEMQRMMNNLQTARPGQQQQQQQDEFSKQMNKLGDMMRQQQQLMDQTFDMQRQQRQQQQQDQNGQQQQNQQQQNQQGQQGQQKPMTPEEFADAMKQLQEQQGKLQEQMQQLQQDMKEQGMDPGKLGEAGEAMGEAESQLGQGETGEATGQQGRALQAMREGAQQMMQNMQNQAGEQGRRGERGQHGQQSREDRDPLGRQSRSQGPQLGDDTKVPGEIDAQRAREILDAIRKKLGEQGRPALELDYLDRLLPTR